MATEPAVVLVVRPALVLAAMVGCALAFTVISLSDGWWAPILDPQGLLQLRRLLSVNTEQNLTTYYQSITQLGCGVLLALIGLATRRAGRRYAAHWLVLAGIFAYLSFDEFASIHETVGDAVGNKLIGPVTYAWVVPAFLAVAVVGVAYVRFLRHLPRRTALLFVLAGALFVGGAAGVEGIQALMIRAGGRRQELLPWLKHLEELGEMLGVAVFAYALVGYAAGRRAAARFRLSRLAAN